MHLQEEIRRARMWEGPRKSGKVNRIVGLLISSTGPDASLGDLCKIYAKDGKGILAQVVGFKEERLLLMPLEEMRGIACGAEVFPFGTDLKIGLGPKIVGRVVDALGRPLDGKGMIPIEAQVPAYSPPPLPLERKSIDRTFTTGIKAIDTLFPIGEGQRMGIFSGSGVGKSTLLSMIAKFADADLSVIALVGERGREVKEFVEKHLGREGLARAVVVAATSDQSPLLRSLGAETATSIAEYFRDRGKKVLLLIDSMSRYAMARREIGVASGEPLANKGYPPSIFASLPKLLERAGNTKKGSITGIYTVLAETEDWTDPIADHMRSLLDGHIYLTAELAAAGQYPPIDPLKSLSRLMADLLSKEEILTARRVKEVLFHYKTAEDLINIGAYAKGSNQKIDDAIDKIEGVKAFLSQDRDERYLLEKSKQWAKRIVQ